MATELAERLPACPDAWKPITIRQLLSHTSGLPEDTSLLFAHMRDDLEPRQLVDLYSAIPLSSAPGTQWEYANLNYWILGLVIEAVTRERYQDYVTSHVLAPAKLRHTRMASSTQIIANRVHGYEIAKNGTLSNARYFSPTLSYSAGGYISSPADMIRWYHALSSGRIVSPELLHVALTKVRLADGSSAPYGLGWYIASLHGHVVAHHGGSSLGFRSYVYWDPAQDIVALSFYNSSGPDEPEEETRALFERVDAALSEHRTPGRQKHRPARGG